MSQTLGVIRRAFRHFYPKNSGILIGGSYSCNPIGVLQMLNVSNEAKEEVVDGVMFSNRWSGVVFVTAFVLDQQMQLSDEVLNYLEGYDALLYLVDAVKESDEQALQRIEASILSICSAMNESRPTETVVAVLVMNTKQEGARGRDHLSEGLSHVLNATNRAMFAVRPGNRLGFLPAVDFVGDHLTLQQRVRTRIKWKKLRLEARQKYDDDQKDKKRNRAERRQEKKRKKEAAKEIFYKSLDLDGKSDGDKVTWDDLKKEEEDDDFEEGMLGKEGEGMEEEEEEGMEEEEEEGEGEGECMDFTSSSSVEGYSSSDSSHDSSCGSGSKRRYSDTDPSSDW